MHRSVNLSIANTIAIALLMLYLPPVVVAEESWPDVPFPDDVRVTVVSEEMDFNGVPMRAWEISALKPAEYVFQFYRDEWQRGVSPGAPGYTEYTVGDWTVISRLEDEFLITVQIDKSAQRAKGLVGISKLPGVKVKPRLGKHFPALGNMDIVNDITSEDLGKKSRTIVASTDASFGDCVRHYRAYYLRRGWSESTQAIDYNRQNVAALLFNKGNREQNIAITDKGEKRVVVAVTVSY